MKNSKKPFAIWGSALTALTLVFTLTACADQSQPEGSSSSDTQADPAVAPGDVAGFEEFDIGDPIEVGPLNVAGVYFQPVDMDPASGGLPKAESDMHMEADISALANNNLGYGAGDFVPYLKVSYEILKEDGTPHLEGTFMPMNASDGPHYGANIKLGEAGKYKVRFIIEDPTKAYGYLLHTDPVTGVEGRFWNEPLTAEWDFNYVPREW
ncbi:MAG: iron transporter [Bifidobacteriaceae bacterium]|nr:iron transporter [Bifidobacteriaceae bacterium]